ADGEAPEGMMGGGPGGGGGGPAPQEGNSFEVTSEELTVEAAEVYTVAVSTTNAYIWGAADGADVTSWIVTEDGGKVFTDESGIATLHCLENGAAEIEIDVTKVTGFDINGITDIYLRPSDGCILNDMGYAIGITTDAERIGSVRLPEVTVEGEVYGSGNTNSASCLVDVTEETLIFDEEGAKIVLSMDGLEDDKIDAANAVVSLLPGDGYTINDFNLTADAITGEWSNGTVTYNLKATDFMWNNSGYEITNESGCGLEWSCFGGDGAGHYRFRFGVSGITYNGLPLGDVVIPVHVYIYGRSAADLAASDYGTLEAAWSWEGAGEKPILCDPYEDVFTAQWPAGLDASGITEEDISVVLTSEYGDELVLKAGEDYSLTASASGRTEITVRYQNWSFTPVYTTMRIDVNDESLAYDREIYTLKGADTTFDIASVYAYSVQSGGNMSFDHAVSYNYYGVNLESWEQVQQPMIYRLTTMDETGAVRYYAEDEGGSGYLTDSLEEAKTYDATGAEDYNYTLVNNHVVYLTMRFDQTVTATVEGSEVTLNKEYDCAYESTAIDPYGSFEPINQDIEVLPGYVLGTSWLQHAMWAWKADIGLGWLE
ncbi:MAG: hypothetical protein Q4C61_09220, partial [Lachnospiraceae bacterium]|nr:hypothetical protein [Lachnospiraceae bacterium]